MVGLMESMDDTVHCFLLSAGVTASNPRGRLVVDRPRPFAASAIRRGWPLLDVLVTYERGRVMIRFGVEEKVLRGWSESDDFETSPAERSFLVSVVGGLGGLAHSEIAHVEGDMVGSIWVI